VLKLDKLTKAKDQLKSDQNRWISHFLHGSKTIEKEVDKIFGDKSIMLQEIFQILKLNNLVKDELKKYYHLNEIRRYNEDSIRFNL
jgi:hypothetical protein